MAAVAQEHAEQLVFAVGQQGFAAGRIDQATAVGVQRPVGKLLDRFGRRDGGRWRLRMTYPANQVFRPGHQLPWIEGFDHVVIGAAFEADDAVDFVVAPGDQDDPDFRAHPQLAGQGQAVLARQADVEHHQVDALAGQEGFRQFRRGGAMDVVTFLGQVGVQQIANQRIVIDDQYPRSHRLVSGIGPEGPFLIGVFSCIGAREYPVLNN
ncbi:hypothetical protein D3C76_693890 [compost metagenome]